VCPPFPQPFGPVLTLRGDADAPGGGTLLCDYNAAVWFPLAKALAVDPAEVSDVVSEKQSRISARFVAGVSAIAFIQSKIAGAAGFGKGSCRGSTHFPTFPPSHPPTFASLALPRPHSLRSARHSSFVIFLRSHVPSPPRFYVRRAGA
jgi:hypothetical protein